MPSRILTIIAFLLIISTGAALAQTIEDNNVLAFYFDEGATMRSWYGEGEVTAYLIAGPMVWGGGQPAALLNYWSCWELIVMPVENYTDARLTMRGMATPAVVELNNGWTDLSVIMNEPLPLDGHTVVAELTLNVVSTTPTALHVWGGQYEADSIESMFEILTAGPDGPMDMTGHTANINADAPVPTDHQSWDQLKSLYR